MEEGLETIIGTRLAIGLGIRTRLGTKNQGLKTRKKFFQAEHFRLIFLLGDIKEALSKGP